MATRVGHVSRVWDHVHWIPGEILPQFYVRHLSVALLELELENYQIFRTAILGKSQIWRGCVILLIANFFVLAVMKNPKPLLYTNMTPTKTPIASEPLNLAF